MGIPDDLTYLLRNQYADQEATVRTLHKTIDCFKMGKEYDKAVYCHPAYVTSMQTTSRKPEVPASPRDEALFHCANHSGVPRGPC